MSEWDYYCPTDGAKLKASCQDKDCVEFCNCRPGYCEHANPKHK